MCYNSLHRRLNFSGKRDNFDNQQSTINNQQSTINNQQSTINKAEFDTIAEEYSRILEQDISAVLKGNPHEYFEQYKMYHLKKIFSPSAHIKVLDYGCGIGLFARTLSRTFPAMTIHGFDVSSGSVQKISPELRKGSNRFTSNLDELDTDYDAAFLITVLHHVLPVSDRTGAVRNIFSRLKPGGQLIVIENNMMNPLMRKLVNSTDIDANAVMLRPSECRTLMKDAGFDQIRNKYIEFFPKQLACFMFADRFISWIPLGAQYMITGRKP